jgi:hypothetical protein
MSHAAEDQLHHLVDPDAGLRALRSIRAESLPRRVPSSWVGWNRSFCSGSQNHLVGSSECKIEVIQMKLILFTLTFLSCALIFGQRQEFCSLANGSGDSLPKRLVIIKGKATIINFPGKGEIPATSETLIFQKVGCESCFIGANVDTEGNYKIYVSDGKYKIIVRNPSSPHVDWLAPDQERFVDTGCENSPDSVFNFDIKIKMP